MEQFMLQMQMQNEQFMAQIQQQEPLFPQEIAFPQQQTETDLQQQQPQNTNPSTATEDTILPTSENHVDVETKVVWAPETPALAVPPRQDVANQELTGDTLEEDVMLDQKVPEAIHAATRELPTTEEKTNPNPNPKVTHLTGSDMSAAEHSGYKKWPDMFEELKKYKETHGHCSVPVHYPSDKCLALWAKAQRRNCREMKKNRYSPMTAERADLLDSIGFVWKVKKPGMRC